jgi:hypothetical protein
MRPIRPWTALSLIPLLWMLVQPLSVVQACGGGGSTPLEQLIADADYVAKVRVIQTDDVSQNAFVHVERYLVGGAGPQVLFLEGDIPAVTQRIYDRFPIEECIDSSDDLKLGDVFYVMLRRSSTGTYHGIGEIYYHADFFHFPNTGSQVRVYFKGAASETLTEAQFVQAIANISGEIAAEPKTDSITPTEAPLVITTTSGADYLLPLDGRHLVPITEPLLQDVVLAGYMSRSPNSMWGERLYNDLPLCPDIDCFVFHPLNTAFRPGDNRILLTWGWDDASELTGQSLSVSPAADAAAVWNHDTLSVYLLRYALPLPHIQPFNMTRYTPLFMDSVRLKTGEGILSDSHHAAWSPDSRQLAYSDAAGLWLWDPLGGGQPRLLIPAQADVVPYPRYFSPRGRYLAVTAGDRRYNLDLVSGDELDDGFFSSDDRLLLALTPTQAAGFYDVSVQQFAPPDRDVPFVNGTTIHQAAWLDDDWFLTVQCSEPNTTSCHMLPMNINGSLLPDGKGNVLTYEGYSFDLAGYSYASIVDAHTINFNGTLLDLSATLDSDIATIRFLPSLFYRHPS